MSEKTVIEVNGVKLEVGRSIGRHIHATYGLASLPSASRRPTNGYRRYCRRRPLLGSFQRSRC